MKNIVGHDAKIDRPCRKADVRIIGLDEDTTEEDIANAIIKIVQCDREDIKVGIIRRNRIGIGDVWVKYPRTSALKLNREGKIKLGWIKAKIILIDPAPRQCFRCWEYGHIKAQCRNTRDRANNYYRCGKEGHRAAECRDLLECALCKETGKMYNHRMGNTECSSKLKYVNYR